MQNLLVLGGSILPIKWEQLHARNFLKLPKKKKRKKNERQGLGEKKMSEREYITRNVMDWLVGFNLLTLYFPPQ